MAGLNWPWGGLYCNLLMKTHDSMRLFLLGWLLVLVAMTTAQPVDPSWPGEWHERKAAEQQEQSRWPREAIRQLEGERDQLLEAIALLPHYEPKVSAEYLGYHSLFQEPGSDGSLSAPRIDVTFVWPRWLDSIALAPAFNPLESVGGIYAFPKRFKIEVLDNDTGRFVEVVNWTKQDFPFPGPYPVFFSGINRHVNQVRLTFPQVVRESGVAYFALGEMYLFFQQQGQLADNMAMWGSSGVKIEVSDSFSMPPLWDASYLYDGIVGLGVPLSAEQVDVEDLIVTYTNGASISDEAEFMLDLGSLQSVGRIDLWPAEAPYLLALPSIGFPRKITIALSADPDFQSAKVIEVENIEGYLRRSNPLPVICEGYEAQYVRITMEDLPEFKGQRILGMGEISVSQFGRPFSVGCKVSARGIPDEYQEQLPRLVDGYCRQRRILQEGEWIKGLAMRRPLDRRLRVVERELEWARSTWRSMQQRVAVWSGAMLCVVLIGAMALQRLQRRRILKKLKHRITRDLHDEVGSNLGSITLAAQRMESAEPDAKTKKNLSELSLMAREASASLRDVVWLIDQTTIRLPMLAHKLAERAECVLSGMKLSVDVSPDCPDRVVPLTFKRHLIMFFKEAVHNCARHSNATEVRIAITADNEVLKLLVQDNGCGFDPEAVRDGWGLDSMQKRAQELGGEVSFESQPGKGTTVLLTVALSALLKQTDHLYKTSN